MTRTGIALASRPGRVGRVMITPVKTLGRAILALCAVGGLAAAEPAWRPLFNGRDLDGWDTYLARPDPSWDVPGMKRDEKGRYTEAIGVNRDPLHVFNI